MIGSILQVAGLIAITTGAFLISPATGAIAGGVAIILIGLALEKS